MSKECDGIKCQVGDQGQIRSRMVKSGQFRGRGHWFWSRSGRGHWFWSKFGVQLWCTGPITCKGEERGRIVMDKDKEIRV
ncbi:hypothetical protein GALMADRAFT_1127337 [Galerina marginata CBS 339.88]|uniref:Uncharacterized protein n=1 Tax=Galerina marginata (strain CBS 339.88) TaxID=685588 RepID=A0A067S8X5_GALM3|nr:hypothetical protein GALMADRAFT_1127337 [Galerina marginata CBS 339.88]